MELERELPYTFHISQFLIDHYQEMYILPEYVGDEYRDANVPFSEYDYFPSAAYRNLAKDTDFWYVSMLAAWEKSAGTAGDPFGTGTKYGITEQGGDYGQLYVEPIREIETGVITPTYYEDHVMLHESAHALGLKHDDAENPTNIMNTDMTKIIEKDFTPSQILWIRRHASQTAQ